MFGHGLDIAAQAIEKPVASCLGIGHRLQGGEGFRRDNKKGVRRVQVLDGFGKVRPVDIRNEAENHSPLAVVFESLVSHHRTEI